MFVTRPDKIILMQVMRRENKKRMGNILPLLHFLEVYHTSFPPKYFFQQKNMEKFKTVFNGLFSHALLMF